MPLNSEQITDGLKLTAKLMELHNENPFKIRSLSNAAFRLDKSGIDIAGISREELEKIDGIGKSIAAKIIEFREQGTTTELKELLDKTPAGVIGMMGIKGIGPKKVALLWKELGIESVGELLYACHENRLVTLKGFGDKTQELVRKNIEFLQSASGKFHYASVEKTALAWEEKLKQKNPGKLVSATGPLRRKCVVLDCLDFIVSGTMHAEEELDDNGIRIRISTVPEDIFYQELLKRTGSEEFIQCLGEIPSAESEEAIFGHLGLPYLHPESREKRHAYERIKAGSASRLIEYSDLRGCLHNHSTWSDGLHSLEMMATHCASMGYEYFGICDHSKTAAYAGGLSIERVLAQQQEADVLNRKLAPFRIFKGIESDILSDGSLDYPEEILKTFDLVVASVHQNLKMDLEKAMKRLIKAIENPYTTILGHPTGRLLLSREGYPVDHRKLIDACAANGVAIELNAHPWRLDIDWEWIPYCMEKGVLISINPDAHEKEGMMDMYYGTLAARKGLLTKEFCLNAKNLEEITAWISAKRSR